MLKCPVFRRFLRVKRIVDTVGVWGSNPHAPTNRISRLQRRRPERVYFYAVSYAIAASGGVVSAVNSQIGAPAKKVGRDYVIDPRSLKAVEERQTGRPKKGS